MGCVSSTNKDPDQAADDKKAGAAAISPQLVASASAPGSDANTDKLKQQRRRLSLGPNMVNNIAVSKNPEPATIHAAEAKAASGLRVKTLSQTGSVPYNRNKVNQDRAIEVYSLPKYPGVCVFGVMDGHGEYGHDIAQFVQQNMPQYLNLQENLLTEPEAAIHTAVKLVVEQLHRDYDPHTIMYSGTTCVFGVKIQQKLYVANIGDSRCVLARKRWNEEQQKEVLEFVRLSNDQKPEVPSEKERILAAGGRVEPLPGPPGEDCGPPRVWLKTVDVPGLAMSRSIGDTKAAEVGVISTPEIMPWDLTDKDLFVVWASDGVWEFLDDPVVVAVIAENYQDLDSAAKRLIERSTAEWKRHEEVVDDITCVIIAFH